MRDVTLKQTALAAFHIILFAAAAVLIATFLLVWRLWGYVSLEQILFHFTVPLSGSFNKGLTAGIWIASIGAFAATVLYAWLYFRTPRRSLPTLVLVAALAAAAALAESRSGATGFILRQFQTTKLFDRVPRPNKVKFSFPGEKRNLLVIHMESMEETFARPEVMGANLIPELTQLQQKNVHFTGFRQVRGTSWTTAGETGSSLGLPLLLPIGHNDYGNYESFLPGALSVFEVLEHSGYSLEFVFPNDCSFGGIENLIRTHSENAVIKDLRWFTNNRTDTDRHRGNNWGLRDRYLYDQLRQELRLRAASGAPYAIFVETIDTHGPDTFYFLDPDTHAPERFHDFRDVIRAGSLMMHEFLEWVQRQDFARDLTIVILGDHLWMGDTIAGRELSEDRTVYNVFINPLAKVEQPGERLFCTPDFAPTILEAVGARLPDRRFGIGTSLFSSQPTIMEQLGEEQFVEELGKTSKRYNQFFRRPRGKRRTQTAVRPVNDFSAAAPTISFRSDSVFMHSAPYGTVQFVLSNTTPSTLSGRGENGLSLRAEVLAADGTPIPGCDASASLLRDMPPQDVEMTQIYLPLPAPGEYRLRVSFAGAGAHKLPAKELPLTIAPRWLYAGEPFDGAGAPGSEQRVIDSATPCLVFPGQMEVYEQRGTLYFKLIDRALTADGIILRGIGARLQPRLLRRASGRQYRWAAAELGNVSPSQIEAGLAVGSTVKTQSFSLLPSVAGRNLREEDDLVRYISDARESGALLLAVAGKDDGDVCLAAVQGSNVLTIQNSASGALHYETETDGSFVELNVYADPSAAASPVYTRLSVRVDGVEYAVAQRGLNFVVYDPVSHKVIDRAAFDYHDPLPALSTLLYGGPGTLFAASPASHRYADARAPIEKGAYIASWPNGPYVTKFNGRLYFQTPWEHAFDVQLLASPLTRPFSPLEKAVSASPSGVISCVPASGAGVCEIGFTAKDGTSHTVAADLRPLYLESSFAEYLRRLNDPDLVTFISVLEEGARRLTDTHRQLFAALGLDMTLRGTRHHAYAAVSDGGEKVLEELDATRIDEVLSVGDLGVRLISTGEDGGFRSSIMLDGAEYSAQSLGMNIVVYSKKAKRVIDSVCFNTYSDLTASRKDPRYKRP